MSGATPTSSSSFHRRSAPSHRRAGAGRVGAGITGVLALCVLGGLLSAAPLGAAPDPEPIVDATLTWSLNGESNSGAFNGSCNYLSAGRSDGSAATYAAVEGPVRVLRPGADGTLRPIGTYEDRCLDRNGQRVTPTGSTTLERLVSISGGTGQRDPRTGEVSVDWLGSFSVTFYGSLVPVWFSDPGLRIDATGRGTITATMGGFGSDISDPEVREPIDPVPGVVIATWSGAQDATGAGLTVSPDYAGVVVRTDDAPQFRLDPGWGSWPQSFVDFHSRTGLAAFWYSTGGLADRRKAPSPIAISYSDQVVLPPTTTVPGTHTTTIPGVSTTIPGTTTTVSTPPNGAGTTTIPAGPVTTTTTTPPVTPDGSSGSGGVIVTAIVPDRGAGQGPGTDVLPDGDELPDNAFVWTIDTDASGVALEPIDAPAAQRRFAGRLGGVTVTDTRVGAPGWSLTGQASGFGGGVPGGYLGWEPFVVNNGAGAQAGPAVQPGYPNGSGLASPSLLASGREGREPGRTTVDAELELRLPGSTPAGTYRATLTLTALG